jgi:SAM-dependent methyltransferase
MAINVPTRTVLNIGCGTSGDRRLPPLLKEAGWTQLRVDIDPNVQPDIVASFSDLHMFHDDSVDAIWSSHNLEHLPWHEVGQALAEAKRVLRPDGFMIVTLPDLEHIAQLIVDGKLMDVQYESPVGPITALDMLFGHLDSQASGSPFMAHRSGFTAASLGTTLLEAGFTEIKVAKGRHYDLWALASLQQVTPRVLSEFQACAA